MTSCRRHSRSLLQTPSPPSLCRRPSVSWTAPARCVRGLWRSPGHAFAPWYASFRGRHSERLLMATNDRERAEHMLAVRITASDLARIDAVVATAPGLLTRHSL